MYDKINKRKNTTVITVFSTTLFTEKLEAINESKIVISCADGKASNVYFCKYHARDFQVPIGLKI